MYEQQQGFFQDLKTCPNWLTVIEWITLKCYYAPDIPCEPQSESVIRTAAGKLFNKVRSVTSVNQGAMLARAALKTGRDKVKQKLEEQTNAPEAPRSRYELWQSGLLD